MIAMLLGAALAVAALAYVLAPLFGDGRRTSATRSDPDSAEPDSSTD